MEQKAAWEARAAELLSGEGSSRIQRDALEGLLAEANGVSPR